MDSNCSSFSEDVLIESLTDAISSIKSQDIDEALIYLKKAESLLESRATQGQQPDPDLVIVTLHNIALCYQKQGSYEECASYLDGCSFNAKSKSAMTGNEPAAKLKPSEKFAVKLRKARYACKVNLQLCAVLSLVANHETALVKAKKAAKYAHECVKLSHQACKTFLQHNKKAKQTKEQQQLHELVTGRWPVFEYLNNKTSDRLIKRVTSGHLPKVDLRSVLGVNHYRDWVDSYSMGDIMMIEPVSVLDLKTPPVFKAELAKDLVFEKVIVTQICLLVASYFCIATETKFIDPIAKESVIWHRQAYGLAKGLLPAGSALLGHLKSSYLRSCKANKKTTKGKSKEKSNTGRLTKAEDIEEKEIKDMETFEESSEELKDGVIARNISRTFLSGSGSSMDSDYFRENFVLSSDDLYGIKSQNASDEDGLFDSSLEDGKYDYMPLSIDQTRIASSTGGNL